MMQVKIISVLQCESEILYLQELSKQATAQCAMGTGAGLRT